MEVLKEPFSPFPPVLPLIELNYKII